MIQQQAQGLANALTGAAFLYTQTPEFKTRSELRPKLKAEIAKSMPDLRALEIEGDFGLKEDATKQDLEDYKAQRNADIDKVTSSVGNIENLAAAYKSTASSERGKKRLDKELGKMLGDWYRQADAAIASQDSASDRARKAEDVIERQEQLRQTAERQKTFREMLQESNPEKREELMNTWRQNFPTNKQ